MSSTRFELANAIRALAMDAVQKANSGHPGMPMGMADIAEVLWNDFLQHNPSDPNWFNRDRFVVSNGHGSMLLYSLLHLTGYDLPLEELKNFRQLHSKTPGHPEYGMTPGVETTTGPLGQGLANAVGMALAERLLAARFNRDGFAVVDHHTYVFAGDGCLMEGISHEACSLAGTLGPRQAGRCSTTTTTSRSTAKSTAGSATTRPGRFEAYGWQVIRNVNGHDPAEIKKAIETARKQDAKPTLICCKTIIGCGAPNKQGKEAATARRWATTKSRWRAQALELAARAVRNAGGDPRRLGCARPAARRRSATGEKLFDGYAARISRAGAPSSAAASRANCRKTGTSTIDDFDRQSATADKADRHAQGFAERAQCHRAKAAGTARRFGRPDRIQPDQLGRRRRPCSRATLSGNYIYYGVREFGMTAMMNGIALHGGFIPFGGTFLMFSDYARNAVRMAALMKIRHDLRLHARLDRPGRRRPDAPVGRARGVACG